MVRQSQQLLLDLTLSKRFLGCHKPIAAADLFEVAAEFPSLASVEAQAYLEVLRPAVAVAAATEHQVWAQQEFPVHLVVEAVVVQQHKALELV